MCYGRMRPFLREPFSEDLGIRRMEESSSGPTFGQAVAVGIGKQLQAIRHLRLGEDGGEMMAHSSRANERPCGNLLIF